MFSFCNRQFLTLDIIIPLALWGIIQGDKNAYLYLLYVQSVLEDFLLPRQFFKLFICKAALFWFLTQ